MKGSAELKDVISYGYTSLVVYERRMYMKLVGTVWYSDGKNRSK